jgi:ankyrin repeat protein
LRQQLKRLQNCAHRGDSSLAIKSQLIAIVAAVVLVGCGPKAPVISIHQAASQGNIEVVKQHLADGADVNAKNKVGAAHHHAPLHFAAMQGHKEIAEQLIANGADVNAKGKVGATPLEFAELRNHTELANLLRKHGGKTGEELKAEGK